MALLVQNHAEGHHRRVQQYDCTIPHQKRTQSQTQRTRCQAEDAAAQRQSIQQG
jgi:hypothetical protein